MAGERAAEKASLRRQLLAARQALPAETRRDWSQAICERLGSSPFLRSAAHVVAYVPLGAEVDPTATAAAVLHSGRELYLPCSDGVAAMRTASVSSVPRHGELLSRNDERVVFLVPGVAFDAGGGRLGRGRGWYDRLFERFDRARRIGLGFDLQVVPRVPRDPWDVPMDAVVTEQRSIEPGRSPGLPEGRTS